jgi:hypothetical protein
VAALADGSSGGRDASGGSGIEGTSSGARPKSPGVAFVTSGGRTRRVGAGSYCLSSAHGAYCEDSIATPGGSARPLPVSRGAPLGIRIYAPARTVRAHIVQVRGYSVRVAPGELVARPVDARRLSWVARLPAGELPSRAHLRFRVGYRKYNGDELSFIVPLTPAPK